MDIRWEQRFSNYSKAMDKLQESVEYIQSSHLNEKADESEKLAVLDEMVKEGLIQRFEYTHELAWKVMKDFAEYQGVTNISGSRDAIREALQMNLIHSGEVWMDMMLSRNKSSHTYNEATANEIYSKILSEYFPELKKFRITMEEKQHENRI
jgi:nucleotidyltransferase substrate binding protein (TIGR01987 family)